MSDYDPFLLDRPGAQEAIRLAREYSMHLHRYGLEREQICGVKLVDETLASRNFRRSTDAMSDMIGVHPGLWAKHPATIRTHWLAAKMAEPTGTCTQGDSSVHVNGCNALHGGDCNCLQIIGVRSATMPNPYGGLSSEPEPKQWTEREQKLGRAIHSAVTK